MGQSLGFPCFHKVHNQGGLLPLHPPTHLLFLYPGVQLPRDIIMSLHVVMCFQIMPRRNQRQGGARRRGGRPRGRGGRINPVPRAQNRDRSRSPPLLVRVPQDSDSSSGDDQIQQLPAPAPAPAPQPVLDDIQQALTAVNSRLDLLERGNDQRAAQQAVFLPQAPAPPLAPQIIPAAAGGPQQPQNQQPLPIRVPVIPAYTRSQLPPRELCELSY